MPRGRKPKLNAEQKDKARWLYKHTDMSIAAIARRFDVAPTTIARAIDEGPTMEAQKPIPFDLDTPQKFDAMVAAAREANDPKILDETVSMLALAFRGLYDRWVVADNARVVAEQTVATRDQQLAAAREHVDRVTGERDKLEDLLRETGERDA